MPPILEASLRFSDAVYAVERTPKAVRKWLQNPGVGLFTETVDHQWRKFSFGDIAMLAIMAKSIEFGLGVVEANNLAMRTMECFGPLFEPEHVPTYALAAAATGHTLLVWREGDKVSFVRKPFWKGDGAPATAYLVIQLEPVIRRAFDRAVESQSEGEDEEAAE